MNPITGLLTALGGLTVMFVGVWTRVLMAARRSPGGSQSPATDTRVPSALDLGIGAVTNFLDTLGIGSFATTTAIFRLWRLVPDRIIPGTLNAGHTLPTVVQAFIYTSVIPVDVLTLFSMITAAVLGAWLGAGVVACWPKRKVQIGMGVALLAAAVFMLMKQLSLFPPGSEEIGVHGAKLALAAAEISVATSVVLFILDLPRNTRGEDIPYHPPRLELGVDARSRLTLGYRIR